MVDQGFAITRSRSDNQITKSLVWSPTPIREMNVSFLESLSCPNSGESSFDAKENSLVIRKYQSAGLIGLEQR
jgi:hypothetical protein